jgi:signal transduction histidine kinase
MTPMADETRVRYFGSEPGRSALVRGGVDDECSVELVGDGSEAVTGDTLRDCDCVVVDDTAPAVDGIAVLEAVRAERSDVPLVFIVGRGDGTAVDEALRKGATDFFRTATAPDRYVGLVTRIRTVVERHCARDREAEFREKSSQLDTIFDELPVSLYFKDEAGRHVRVSRGHATGYEGYYPPRGKGDLTIDGPTDFLGKTDRDLFPEGTAAASMADDRSVIEDGESLVRKVEHLEYDDGGERWLTTTKVPWHGVDGEVRGLLGFSLDITERRRYERRLERQNERLAEFANVVSHDLRNPLNVAAGHLELVRREHDSEHLAAIERSHDRMAELVDDLLGLARHGQRVEDIERVPLAECLDRARRTIETDDLTLSVETDAVVRADPSRLQQLFENLLGNAVEHGSTSPPSQAPEDAVEHGSTSPDSGARRDVRVAVGDLDGGFFVEDDGPGIPEADRERVFERSYTTGEAGTGFGLAIVEGIVGAHDWEIRVTGGTDGGARFEITGVESVDR